MEILTDKVYNSDIVNVRPIRSFINSTTLPNIGDFYEGGIVLKLMMMNQLLQI